MPNSYDVIAIDKCVILNTLRDFPFREYSIFVHQFGLKQTKAYIGKLFNSNIILITKYLNLNWNIVKSFIFLPKMIDFR